MPQEDRVGIKMTEKDTSFPGKKNDDYYLKNDAEVFRKTKKPDGE